MTNNKRTRVGSEAQYGPCLAGEILHNYLKISDETLAVAFRKHQSESENWHTNTTLAVNLKTILRSDKCAKVGKSYSGVLRRDRPTEEFNFDEHYSFVESLPITEKRNPHVFEGQFITITRRGDGSLRPNFKPMRVDVGFTVDFYARGVYDELCTALKGLIEE